jgi:hypothetical protein
LDIAYSLEATTAVGPSSRITPVIVQRRLVLVLLLYLTLDLSLAGMPGAFVFEAEDSVESVQMSRVRPIAESAVESAPARDPQAIVVQVQVRQRPLVRPLPLMLIRRGGGSRVPAPEPPAVSEDPH